MDGGRRGRRNAVACRFHCRMIIARKWQDSATNEGHYENSIQSSRRRVLHIPSSISLVSSQVGDEILDPLLIINCCVVQSDGPFCGQWSAAQGGGARGGLVHALHCTPHAHDALLHAVTPCISRGDGGGRKRENARSIPPRWFGPFLLLNRGRLATSGPE